MLTAHQLSNSQVKAIPGLPQWERAPRPLNPENYFSSSHQNPSPASSPSVVPMAVRTLLPACFARTDSPVSLSIALGLSVLSAVPSPSPKLPAVSLASPQLPHPR